MATRRIFNLEHANPAPVRARGGERQFVFMAVHELRASLRAVHSNTDLLADRFNALGNPDGAGDLMGLVLGGVERLETLVNDIAEYCYVEVTDLRMVKTLVESVVQEALIELAEEIRQNEAAVTHDALPTILCDFLSLTAVFRILIENACKFRSEAAPRIHISADRQGANWIFSVEDNGLGFDPVYSERVFEPFERLNGRRYPGTGLGLYICRRILKQHGGVIWAESRPGEGSIFRFSLPALDGDDLPENNHPS